MDLPAALLLDETLLTSTTRSLPPAPAAQIYKQKPPLHCSTLTRAEDQHQLEHSTDRDRPRTASMAKQLTKDESIRRVKAAKGHRLRASCRRCHAVQATTNEA